jgi:hypothetical protein
MRRIAVVAGVVALAAGLLAAVAYAASVKEFAGGVDKGGRIEFSALRDNGKYTRAGLFDLQRIPVKCDEGNTRARVRTSNVVDVTHREFTYKFNFGSPDEKARVSGKFNRKGNKATGVFRASGMDLDSDSTNCTTNGPRDWTAHKQ